MPLPAELERAQEAMKLPEVKAMLRRLADFNLGICMPHLHTDEEDFAVLPPDMVQVERNRDVSFAGTGEITGATLPVAWRYREGSDDPVVECTIKVFD